MLRKKYGYVLVGLVIAICGLAACGKSDIQTAEPVIKLEADTYFLCNNPGDTDFGIIVYDENGKVLLNEKDAQVEYCVKSDGTIIQPAVGLIPSDSMLYCSIRKTQEDAETGLWSGSKKDWVIGPASGSFASHMDGDQGKLLDFSVGDEFYNMDLARTESEDPVYQVTDTLELKNCLDGSGNGYIGYENGKVFLDGTSFYIKNIDTGLLTEQPSVELKFAVNGYMAVTYPYQSIQEDGTILGDTRSYLCDSNGKILHPQLEYDAVSFAQDQYGNIDRNLIRISCRREGKEDSGQVFYLDVETGKLLEFPEGYDEIRYGHGDDFLLLKDGTCTIYNAQTQSLGASFAVSEKTLENIYAFGTDSYAVQRSKGSILVIEGKEQNIPSEMPCVFVEPGPYPAVSMGRLMEPGEGGSYILDKEGRLKLQAEDQVIYADENGYLTVTKEGSYRVCAYENEEEK